jgi:hypothetical protein
MPVSATIADPTGGTGDRLGTGPTPVGPLRTLSALMLASVLAPVLFGTLLLVASALAGSTDPSPVGGSTGRPAELLGMLLIPAVLGGPAAIGAGLAVGLPGIWLARRLHLTGLPVFAAGGGIAALACLAWFASGDILALRLSNLAGWSETGAFMAMTGVACGALYWLLAERRRAKP